MFRGRYADKERGEFRSLPTCLEVGMLIKRGESSGPYLNICGRYAEREREEFRYLPKCLEVGILIKRGES